MMNAASPTIDAQNALAKFHELLAEKGARAALAYVLSLSDFRCIGVYRFDQGMAKAVLHYDRENPEVTEVDAVPEELTYCLMVRDTKENFTTADSLQDSRLHVHPSREVVRSYCGIPIMDSLGTVQAVLCHYDYVPNTKPPLDFVLLFQVAAALYQGGYVPDYTHTPVA